MPYPIPTVARASDPKPGKDALAAYQVRIAECKKKEHETIVNGILIDPSKTEEQRQKLLEIDNKFFAATAADADAKKTEDHQDGDVKEFETGGEGGCEEDGDDEDGDDEDGDDEDGDDEDGDDEDGDDEDGDDEDGDDEDDGDYVFVKIVKTGDDKPVEMVSVSELLELETRNRDLSLPIAEAATTITWRQSVWESSDEEEEVEGDEVEGDEIEGKGKGKVERKNNQEKD